MTIHCRQCFAPIGEADVAHMARQAYCRHCDQRFQFTFADRFKPTQSQQINIPDLFQMVETGHGFDLKITGPKEVDLRIRPSICLALIIAYILYDLSVKHWHIDITGLVGTFGFVLLFGAGSLREHRRRARGCPLRPRSRHSNPERGSAI